jgi:regulator of sigma E protease
MSILLLFLVLFPLVIVHEFGHFIVAKKAGIRVDEFAFGFPPKLFGIKRGETTYAFNALPIGGYVKIYGENPDDVSDDADKSRSFTAKPRIVQAAVIVAGVVFNLLFAWLLISTTLMVGVPAPADTTLGDSTENISNIHLMITEVRDGSPAALAGIASGDTLLSVGMNEDEIKNPNPQSVMDYVSPRASVPTIVTYERKGERHIATIVPISGIVEGRAAIGISMDMVGTLKLKPHMALWQGMQKTYQFTMQTAVGLFGFLRDTVMGKGDFSQVTGPVGMVRAVGDAADVGFTNLLLFTAVISISLAVINVLPFPALDGGRLLFIIIEAVMRRPIPTKIANYANMGGFALLMLLMIAVTWHDVINLM